jgi:hypothetical protein
MVLAGQSGHALDILSIASIALAGSSLLVVILTTFIAARYRALSKGQQAHAQSKAREDENTLAEVFSLWIHHRADNEAAAHSGKSSSGKD